MADSNEPNAASSTDYDRATMIVHDEDNSNISNSTETETVVNNDHAVGRDAGSVGDSRNDSEEQTGVKDQDGAEVDQDVSCESNEHNMPAEYASVFANRSMPIDASFGTEVSLTEMHNLDDSNMSAQSGGDFLGEIPNNMDDIIQDHGYMESEAIESEELDSDNHQHEPTQGIDLDQDLACKKGDVLESRSSVTESAIAGHKHEDLCKADEKEKFNVESLNYELQVGYRILSNMMSASNRCVNKLFLFPVDDNFPETAAYYEKVKKPMWMFKSKYKSS